ncbi:transcription termination/antitermination protein NusG [Spiroplasma sp. TIUS-1]|uniref:transcription termination/antitermination protein NusG n=1 Tax=Spiroplasma sp. TIUS-1 TaxID=216963 RepID=UPI001398FDA5|nr:transcription termination/antitermination protein NusG [Spiroplasma sp. TIUS-1]QHX35586.1 transcription termination/antitermination protein NusG [Spiroplasma sp. TIUS-1]
MEKLNLELLEELESFKGQWFVVNCYSGHEDKVASDIKQKITTNNLSSTIFNVRVSKHSVFDKNKKVVDKNKFPGYIFINMLMTDETWFTIRNTNGVTGFIGSSGKGVKPFPITAEEIARMLNMKSKAAEKEESISSNTSSKGKVVAKKEKVQHTADFKVKDIVLIKNGPFEGMEGQVTEMDLDKGVAIVEIEMFGRVTPSEVEFASLELAYKL